MVHKSGRVNAVCVPLLMAVALVGCSRLEGHARKGPVMAMAAELKQERGKESRYLAYEHSIQLDTPESQMAEVFQAAQQVCRDAAAVDACTVLEASIGAGRYPSASLKFRAKAAGVQKLIAALRQQAQVTEQSTRVEDLEGPIIDSERKLAMLTEYRGKLEALRGRANPDVDALIKLTRELSQVQSDIEAMAGSHARLTQRVETEILNVHIVAEHSRSFWSPIAEALSDFGKSLSQGIAGAITGVAYLIPWTLVLGFFGWIGRALWRRYKRASVSSDRSPIPTP